MKNPLLTALVLGLALAAGAARAAPVFEDTMAQRALACSSCHGKEGRAGPDGYYPRIAGKPVGYLYNQLLNFRDGRRHYGLMTRLLDPLSDAYLLEIARYFAALEAPYPAPLSATAAPSVLQRGQQLAREGDASRRIPACVQCHGDALTGVQPNTPGLLGLPRDYLNSQLGAWQSGQRRAHAPDCMARIARQLGAGGRDGGDQLARRAAAAARRARHPVVAAGPRDLVRQRHAARRKAAAMKRAIVAIIAGLLALLALVLLLDFRGKDRIHDAPPLTPPSGESVARGGYLVRAGNCMACHTQRGGAPFAGGRAIETPFGTVYAGNITPHERAGIGAWSREDFWRALHDGRFARRAPAVPGLPLPQLHAGHARGRRRDVRLPAQHRAGGPRQHAAPPALALQHTGGAGRVARGVFHAGRIRERSVPPRAMEPRGLPRARPGPLRRLPHGAQRAGRHERHDGPVGRPDPDAELVRALARFAARSRRGRLGDRAGGAAAANRRGAARRRAGPHGRGGAAKHAAPRPL